MADGGARWASNSELSAHGECRFRWLMQYHLELRRPPNSASAAELGSDIHECVAHALQGGDWEDAHAWIAERRGLLPDDADVARAMRGWQTAAGRLYSGLSVVGVEVRITARLPGFGQIDGLAGVLDVLAVDGAGRRVVIDHKTTRQTIGQWSSQWGMQAGWQLRVYDWLAEQAGGAGGASIARIDHIDARRGEVSSTVAAIAENARLAAGRILADRLEMLDADLCRLAGVAAGDLDDPALGALMSPSRACSGCDYRDLCKKRLRHEAGLAQLAAEQLVRVGRLDHQTKA